jgi:hypothetical protein
MAAIDDGIAKTKCQTSKRVRWKYSSACDLHIFPPADFQCAFTAAGHISFSSNSFVIFSTKDKVGQCFSYNSIQHHRDFIYKSHLKFLSSQKKYMATKTSAI